MQDYILRGSHNRQSDEEPEIRSAFSTDKSSDFAVKPRAHKKSKYDQPEQNETGKLYFLCINLLVCNKLIILSIDHVKFNFGYEEKTIAPQKPTKIKFDRNEHSKRDFGVKDLKIKFDFGNDLEDSDEDDMIIDKIVSRKSFHS